MEEQIKAMLSDFRCKVMLEYEQICEQVMVERCNDSESLKFQNILDEAQNIFESRHPN